MKITIYDKIIEKKDSQKNNTIWYTAGSLCNSMASMIILIIVTRILGQEQSGLFSLAWSAAQLMLTIGWFSMRQYQVSDVQEKYNFYEYRMAKIISSIVMILSGVLYCFIYNYSFEQFIITFLLCIFMINEVWADFYSGFFQHKGKLHISGKSYTARNIVYIIIFTICLFITKNLILAICIAILINIIWLSGYDYPLSKKLCGDKRKIQLPKVFSLFYECVPLFLGSFITSFIMNVPKNAINLYMDNSAQACYNILFMPSAVVNMLNLFICVPMYDQLAIIWYKGEKTEFAKKIYKMLLIVMCISVFVLLGGFLLGIPVLSWIYNIDLSGYRGALMLLLFGGSMNGAISVLTYSITVMRKQKVILYVYGIIAVGVQLLAGIFVRNFGVSGAAGIYALAMTILCVTFLGLVMYYIKKNREK